MLETELEAHAELRQTNECFGRRARFSPWNPTAPRRNHRSVSRSTRLPHATCSWRAAPHLVCVSTCEIPCGIATLCRVSGRRDNPRRQLLRCTAQGEARGATREGPQAGREQTRWLTRCASVRGVQGSTKVFITRPDPPAQFRGFRSGAIWLRL